MSSKFTLLIAFIAVLGSSGAFAETLHVTAVETLPSNLQPMPTTTGGRMQVERAQKAAATYTYQWPGAYFEATFAGTAVYFTVGPGDEILHVWVDSKRVVSLVKPADGSYRVEGLENGTHTIRIEVANENQAAPATFGGFALPPNGKALASRERARQIEFIGDSYTVGYGNISPKRECTTDEVWATTDTSQAFGPLVARHYDADYQINAISGRGIVRNWDGTAGDPLPVAYPFVLFDKKTAYEDQAWRPQIIVIALGANDFLTALHPQEKWQSPDELRADFEATYVRFVKQLRARNPKAFFILMATDGADGEIQSQVKKVLSRLRAAGENKIDFIPMNALAMTGCHYHPSTVEDKKVADSLIRFIDSHPQLWQSK
jgi:lysophospholipase L1-like esterase